MIHEWWGLNDWAKGKADGFAKQGYVALAVDLYRGKVTADPDTAHQLMRGMPDDRSLRDMKAAVAYLRTRPDVDSAKIGSVGWCMGGGLSLNLAVAEPTLAGAVIYYGHLMTDPTTIAGLKVPLLGNFGGQDQGIPAEGRRGVRGRGEEGRQERRLQDLPRRRPRLRVVEGPQGRIARRTRRTPMRGRTRFFGKVLKGR